MKKIMKKNQIIITALAIMIAVAGYLNFSSRDVSLTDNDIANETEGAQGNSDDSLVSAPVEDTIDDQDLALDVNTDVLPEEGEDVALSDEAAGASPSADEQSTIGEAVLTSSDSVANFMLQTKLNREQVRSRSKDMLLEIINNTNISEEMKQDAVNKMLTLTDNMEKESSAEQQLGAKGFLNSIVNISEDSIDVTINKSELTEVEKAQIEDIVVRKTGCSLDKVVITTIKTQN